MAVKNLQQSGDDAAQEQRVKEESRLSVETAPADATLSGPRWGRRPQNADDAMEATLTTHTDALRTLGMYCDGA